jgi:murein DD-endopeptidase MepM/ murein hydrolase activator NlpD
MIPDWATSSRNTLGWDIAEWVRANQVCLGVTYVVWDATIWSSDRPDEGLPAPQRLDRREPTAPEPHPRLGKGDVGSCADGAWVVPLAGDYVVTARFGDVSPHWATAHTGVDLAAPLGRPVLAAAGGQVTYADWDGLYGLKVEITHAGATRTWYAHLSTISINAGRVVAAGDVIGQLGSTGTPPGLYTGGFCASRLDSG